MNVVRVFQIGLIDRVGKQSRLDSPVENEPRAALRAGRHKEVCSEFRMLVVVKSGDGGEFRSWPIGLCMTIRAESVGCYRQVNGLVVFFMTRCTTDSCQTDVGMQRHRCVVGHHDMAGGAGAILHLLESIDMAGAAVVADGNFVYRMQRA